MTTIFMAPSDETYSTGLRSIILSNKRKDENEMLELLYQKGNMLNCNTEYVIYKELAKPNEELKEGAEVSKNDINVPVNKLALKDIDVGINVDVAHILSFIK